MLKSIKSNKISEHIVEQIRNAIFEEVFKPGDKLPSEKELRNTFQVSKPILREAIRSLEFLGFLEIRKGVSGGAFVVEVNLKKAIDSFANFLYFRNLSLRQISEVRIILESYIAEKVASLISKEDIKKLKMLNEEFENDLNNNITLESFNRQIAFHQIIGNATSNPILIFISEFVANLLIQAKESLHPDRNFYKKVLEGHKRIYKALLEKNPNKIRKEMIRHIREEERDLVLLQRKRAIQSGNYRYKTKWPSSPAILLASKTRY
jgi:GntR family transcriptional repressor for pyruvate dehydrogenase complex